MTGDDDVDKKVKNRDVGPGKSSSNVGPGQVHGSGFGWESFLHVRSIKVLLVEYDDCTRLVVTALLRNCNYEVIEASNGIQAWKILENLTNHIDLILTEVVMPCVSGVTLLTKIMSHKTRKNVPVIMMSSHDSMGLVFKCLSKGAVDFLVKPIRKNELKILWQHVWRRCASSSGSGSESGSQTQKSVKSTSSEKSENNKSKNDVDNNENTRVNNVGDESDDGCDSQNTWTKQLITIDSSKELSTENQVAECEDSTCAQVIHSHGEISESKKVQKIVKKKCIVNQQIENVPQGNGLVTQQPEEKPENSLKVLLKQKLPLETEPGINTKILEKGHKVVCLFTSNPQTENKKFVASNILRHSELSAFSRYNSSSNTFKPPNGIVTNSSIIDNHTLEVSKKDSSSEKISTTLRGPHQNLETHHHHHDHSYHYHSFEHDKSSLKKLISMGSASGSNYVSNGQNGRTNLQSDKGLALESGSGSGTRRDEKRSAQREAALIKFLQKRKDRCYKKKVRYQNRKRVAESRPRVRGQFVKQTGEEGLNCETDE